MRVGSILQKPFNFHDCVIKIKKTFWTEEVPPYVQNPDQSAFPGILCYLVSTFFFYLFLFHSGSVKGNMNHMTVRGMIVLSY